MKHLLIITFLLCSISASAQDVIVKKDGSTILSKVLEVNVADIKYKKFSNQNGPTYTISKAEIMSINYENGEKDTFESAETSDDDSLSDSQEASFVRQAPDSRNQEIISWYNRDYQTTKKVDQKNSNAWALFAIYGVSPTSIMSNKDIEVTIERKLEVNPHSYTTTIYEGCYYLVLKNKSSKTILVDMANCFRTSTGKSSFCYLKTDQITVNDGAANQSSLNLGGVTDALGVGGAAGTLAGAVNVGRTSGMSTSTTYGNLRFKSIPPHGQINLTDYKYVMSKRTALFQSDEYTFLERPEEFNDDLGFTRKKDKIKRGERRSFDISSSPYIRNYIITYSTDMNFATYSTLEINIYLREIIGLSITVAPNKIEKYIEGFDEHTIISSHEIQYK